MNVPNYFDRANKELFEELTIKENKTVDEEEFCKRMYHMEECACGLDGD